MKTIVITELEDGKVDLKATKGIKWSTFVTSIEMLLETIIENSKIDVSIDDILADVKRIYERDKNEGRRN